MTAKTAAFALLAVLVAAPAFAQSEPPLPPVPPVPPIPAMPPVGAGHHIWISDGGHVWTNGEWSEKDQAKFDEKMKALDEKLARLDVKLKAQEHDRDARISAIVARAEEHARYASERAAKSAMSPEKVRAITEHAMDQARVGERAAEAAERTMEAIEPQLDALSRRLDNLKRDEDK